MGVDWLQNTEVREFVMQATRLWLERDTHIPMVSIESSGELECELEPDIEVEFDGLPFELRKLLGDMAEGTATALRNGESLIHFDASDLRDRVIDLEAAAATSMTWKAFLQGREKHTHESGCVAACALVCALVPVVYDFYKVVEGKRVRIAEIVEESAAMSVCLQECRGDLSQS